jgi:homoserine O-acetyltransferase
MDYDPAPDLQKISAPLLAINFADDALNPPELGTVERAMPRLRNGRAVLIPAGPQSRGHNSASDAKAWVSHLAAFARDNAAR